MEKMRLEMLLWEKDRLYKKTVDLEERLNNAKRKFDNISNEVSFFI